jgi:hypothetical protein
VYAGLTSITDVCAGAKQKRDQVFTGLAPSNILVMPDMVISNEIVSPSDLCQRRNGDGEMFENFRQVSRLPALDVGPV